MSRKPFILTCIVLLSTLSLHGQERLALDSADYRLMVNAQFVDHQYDARHVTYGFTPGRRTLNPFYHLFSSCMYGYQAILSPLLMRNCAYSPSCSAYSKNLIREYGLLKGIFLTADRLSRCNRISMSDINNKYLLEEGHGHIHETVDRYR